jgi:hypothetical protein
VGIILCEIVHKILGCWNFAIKSDTVKLSEEGPEFSFVWLNYGTPGRVPDRPCLLDVSEVLIALLALHSASPHIFDYYAVDCVRGKFGPGACTAAVIAVSSNCPARFTLGLS